MQPRVCSMSRNARNLRERLPAYLIRKFDAYNSMLGNDNVNSSLVLHGRGLAQVHVSYTVAKRHCLQHTGSNNAHKLSRTLPTQWKSQVKRKIRIKGQGIKIRCHLNQNKNGGPSFSGTIITVSVKIRHYSESQTLCLLTPFKKLGLNCRGTKYNVQQRRYFPALKKLRLWGECSPKNGSSRKTGFSFQANCHLCHATSKNRFNLSL